MRTSSIATVLKYLIVGGLIYVLIRLGRALATIMGSGYGIGGGIAAIGILLFCVGVVGCITLLLAPDVIRSLAERFVSLIYVGSYGKVKKDYSRAKSFVMQQKYNEAIEEYRKAIEEDPKDITPHMEIAEIYCDHLKEYIPAIEEYRKVTEMKITDVQKVSILNRIADIYEQNLNRKDLAIRTLQEIIKKFPQTDFSSKATERIRRI